jgi:hypothetical protein
MINFGTLLFFIVVFFLFGVGIGFFFGYLWYRLRLSDYEAATASLEGQVRALEYSISFKDVMDRK